MTRVKLGGSEFVNCSVPLAFGQRYVILESGAPKPLVTVLVEHQGKLVAEVLKNEPQENPVSEVSKSGAGIVTVADRETGSFLYKVRPTSATSVLFGLRLGDEEIPVRVTDKLIEVGNRRVVNCVFDGVAVGVLLREDGSLALGAQIPDSLRKAFIRS